MQVKYLIYTFWLFDLFHKDSADEIEKHANPRFSHFIAHPQNDNTKLALKKLELKGKEFIKNKFTFGKNISSYTTDDEEALVDLFSEYKIRFEKITNEDFFQLAINWGKKKPGSTQRKISNGGKFNFGHYFTHEEVSSYMDYLSKNYNDFVNVKNIGTTYENRTIFGVVLSQKSPVEKKPVLFFDGGIHAREWFTSTFALYMLNQFIENATIRDTYLPHIDLAIVPLANPDGYTYSRTEDPFWRKNRFPHKECFGTDLNRNFDIAWSFTTDESDLKCESPVYPGPKAFSEAESQAIRNFAWTFPKDSIRLYVGLHSFSQMLMHSYGYTQDPPDDIDDLVRCGNFVNKYLDDMYTVGSAAVIAPPPVGGGSDDYFKTVINAKYSFTMELTKNYGFHPPEMALEREALFAINGIYGFADFIKQEYSD